MFGQDQLCIQLANGECGIVNFTLGVISGLVTSFLVWFFAKVLLPYLQDRIYGGICVDGKWTIYETKDGTERDVGSLTLHQKGFRLTGTSRRTQTRQGEKSDRQFVYKGRIAKDRITLLFEDARGRDFDTGTYVFRVHNDGVTMEGMATFDGKQENRIVSEPRTRRKTASPLPRQELH